MKTVKLLLPATQKYGSLVFNIIVRDLHKTELN
jgi:hypothetical protein